MSAEPRYSTLAELRAAFERGDLSRTRDKLLLDNDSCTITRWAEDGWPTDEVLFRYDYPPGVLLEQALEMLGIPWRNA